MILEVSISDIMNDTGTAKDLQVIS